MKRMIGVALAAAMGLGLASCEEPGPDPDMVMIAAAIKPCDDALNGLTGSGDADPAARAGRVEAAAGACASTPQDIRNLSDPRGDAEAFAVAQSACAESADATMAWLLALMAQNQRLIDQTTTVETDMAFQDVGAANLEARDRCYAALGSPAYQLRRDAGLQDY